MAENRAGLYAAHRPALKVQVSTADSAGGQPHDGVVGLLQLGLGHVVQPDITDSMKHDTLHRTSFRSAFVLPGYAASRRRRCSPNSAIISRLNAGMSLGCRLVTKLPSRTTSLSTQLAPAFRMSSWIV